MYVTRLYTFFKIRVFNWYTSLDVKKSYLRLPSLNFGNDRVPFILALISIAVYIPGIWWGLPHATNPQGVHGWDVDAVTGIQTLSELYNLFVKAQPNWWVAYPPFHYIVLGISYLPYLAYMYLSGGLSGLSSAFPYGLSDPVKTIAILNIIGRSVTLMMACGIVVSTYLTSKIIWDKVSGLFAAFLMMLATPMFYYARTGNLDVPVLFWISLGILMIARILVYNFTIRRGILLGTFAALSVATKDQAYGAWLAGIGFLLIFYSRKKERENPATQHWDWKVSLSILIPGGIVYALASGLVFSPMRFVNHLLFLVNYQETFPNVVQANILRPMDLPGYGYLTGDIFQALFFAIGPFFLILGMVGFLLTWRKNIFTRILLAMGLGYIILTIFPVRHMQYRYILLIVLIFAFFGGYALSAGWRAGGLFRSTTVLLIFLCFGWLIVRGMDLTYQMLFDARINAGNWLTAHCDTGDEVAFFGATPNLLPGLPAGMVPRSLPDDASAIKIIQQKKIQFIFGVPGSFNDVGLERTPFVPDIVFQGLKDGQLGYKRVAVFSTPPLFPSLSKDIPLTKLGYLVNPTIQIYSPDNYTPNGKGCAVTEK
jgi:hypothetical protein